MFIIARTITIVLFASLVLAGSASAASTVAFEGFVKDAKGQPIKGAEILITGKDGKMISKNKTNANGHYVSNALAAGTYRVDLFINSLHKATLPDAKTKSSGSTELNFDLRAALAQTKRRVWVQETGSNAGRWVDPDDPNSQVPTYQLYRDGADYLQRMQDRTAGAER